MLLAVNTRIFPGIVPILELGSNNAIYQVTPRMFQMGMAHPDYVRLGMVCMSISHRMNQTRDDPQSNALAITFLHYRGIIIRSLSKAIDVGHKRTSNRVFAGILTLLIADVSRSCSNEEKKICDHANRGRDMQGPARSTVILATPSAGSQENHCVTRWHAFLCRISRRNAVASSLCAVRASILGIGLNK